MLNVFRLLFILIAAGLGTLIGAKLEGNSVAGAVIGTGLSALLVAFEMLFARRFIATTAVVVLAILFGFILSHFVLAGVKLIPTVKEYFSLQENQDTSFYLDFGVTFVFCFMSVIAILHVKDEFKIVIPFVEFSRGARSGRPLILDTSAIIDGRILEMLDTNILDAQIVVPRFVLGELHQLSDSGDRMKRQRGRRGLEILDKIQSNKKYEVHAPDVFLPNIEGVDNKLINLAKSMNGRILTGDFNLEKVAGIQAVEVVNVNSLAKALRAPVMTGDRLSLEIVKAGENPGQGVGFLEDGTMVVGEGCAHRIGEKLHLTVKNIIQTTAGRIIFAEPGADKKVAGK